MTRLTQIQLAVFICDYVHFKIQWPPVALLRPCTFSDLHQWLLKEIEASWKSLACSAEVSLVLPSISRASPVFKIICPSCCFFTSSSSCSSNATFSAIFWLCLSLWAHLWAASVASFFFSLFWFFYYLVLQTACKFQTATNNCLVIGGFAAFSLFGL